MTNGSLLSSFRGKVRPHDDGFNLVLLLLDEVDLVTVFSAASVKLGDGLRDKSIIVQVEPKYLTSENRSSFSSLKASS